MIREDHSQRPERVKCCWGQLCRQAVKNRDRKSLCDLTVWYVKPGNQEVIRMARSLFAKQVRVKAPVGSIPTTSAWTI